MDRTKPANLRDDLCDPSRKVIRLNVHGLAAELCCSLPGIRQVMADLFAPLLVTEWPEGFQPIEGMVEAYDADVVARHVSPKADRVAVFGDYAELWRDGERCWLIDEGWGLTEINLLKRSWRSWILPQSDLNPIRTVEQAVLWPMSQVMLTRGLSLTPSASIVHKGRGILLLSPFSLEPELSMLVAAGHGLISQRWTAIREEEGRPVLLQMPGRVERSPIPQLRSKAKNVFAMGPTQAEWIDLSADAASVCNYAWCDVVMIVEPGRRALPRMTVLTGASSTAAVRRAWPMPDLGHMQRQAQLSTKLGHSASVYQVELSRDPRALMRLLEQIPVDLHSRQKLSPSLHVRDGRNIAV
jgi:hypothetical protein